MNRRKLEALAEAIADTSGYKLPDNPLHIARNPGGLKAFSPGHQRTDEGMRIFNSFLDGWQALLFDLEVKLSGRSRNHLTAEASLAELAESCGFPATAAQAWAKFIRRATGVEITHKTPISFFGEK